MGVQSCTKKHRYVLPMLIIEIIGAIFGLLLILIMVAMFAWFGWAVGGAFESDDRRPYTDTRMTGSEIGGLIGLLAGIALMVTTLFDL